MPAIIFSQDKLDFDHAIKDEWLITNGLGGYASSTVLGLNTRKYHALLIAALRPPGERTVTLSKLDEDVIISNETFQLGANDFRHNIYPQGYKLLKEFSVSPFPTYTYSVKGIAIKKTIFLPHEKNAVVAFYEVNNQSMDNATVRIFPLVSYRHYHYVIDRNTNPVWLNQTQKENEVELTFNNPAATIISKAIGGKFTSKPFWIEGIFYREEENRGESSIDQSYQPGYFEFQAQKNTTTKFAVVTVVSNTFKESEQMLNEFGAESGDIEKLLNSELGLRDSFLAEFYDSRKIARENDGLDWLLQASNDFIVKGTNDQRFIIAGYQWFGSWGRDTFISLPGLMLVTGKFKEAKSVISDFTRYCKQGVIPNLIDDKTGEPLYNTVDGTLWYINSILQYLKYTNDFEFARSLWPTLNDIIDNHRKGTINGIHVDSDGLLAHGPQLTWMDTVVGGVPFTPRAGKAVEVQALWYNALCTMQMLAKKFGENHIAEGYSAMAEKAKSGFTKFWDSEKNCLFDVIEESGQPDMSVRPNQVIVGALDYTLIDKEKANNIVDFVEKELLTSVGLRTLPPNDSRYKGKYEGSRENRDKVYHSGAIWPWQTGSFITSYLKAKGHNDSNVKYVSQKLIMPIFNDLLPRGGLGTISEIYDGDPPHMHQGCIAQAWSVAEPLRAYIEDVLQIRPKFEKDILNMKPLEVYT